MLATCFVICPKKKKKKKKTKKQKQKQEEVDMYKTQVAYFVKTLIITLSKLVDNNK